VNTGLAPPLLSRFDVVLVLRDARDPEWDERVASHILGETSENSGNINKRLKFSASAQKKPFSFDGWRASQNANADNININNRELYVPANDTNRYRSYNRNEFADGREVSDSDADDENETGEDVQFFDESTALWSFSRVKKYIKYVKSRFEPTLDEDAERMLSEHYQNRRRQVAENRLELGRATVRALESSIRLAQAHAKLCFRNVATKIDATVAIELIGCSEDEMMGNTMNHIGQKGVGILMRDFARYPDRKLSKAFKTFDFDECNGADEFPRIDRNYTRIQ
jgi:DNA replicative helicase MCM subunit Mcm2 (Cdc46/Mcm family)